MTTIPDQHDPRAEKDRLDEPVEGDISLDVMFEILKNSRRRMVLDYLQDHDGQVALSDLADEVTAAENDTDVASITSTERKRVYVGLYQFHLPKMDDMGIIEFDQDRGTISLAQRGRELLRAHKRTSTASRRWHSKYLALATVGFLAVGVSYSLQSTALAVSFLTLQTVLLAGLALAHTAAYYDGLPLDFTLPRFDLNGTILDRSG